MIEWGAPLIEYTVGRPITGLLSRLMSHHAATMYGAKTARYMAATLSGFVPSH